MSQRGEPILRVIHGGGNGASSRPRAALAQVDPAPSRPQLLLPGVASNRPLLICVGFDALTFAGFDTLMRTAGVRRVVDIRKFATFGSRDFEHWLVTDLFQELDIDYQRMFHLGNPFLGTSGNGLIVRQRYAEYIRERSDLVRALGDKLDRSPVLLLDRRREHDGSERDIVARALAELEFEFDLALVRPDGSLEVQDLIPPKKPPRPRSRKHAPPGLQDELPFG